MTYKWLKENVSVKRLADGACIPNDAGNTDWREFHRWVADGGICGPCDPEPTPVDQNDFNNATRIFRAKCLSDLAFRLNKLPKDLTQAEIAAERQRIKNIADAIS